MRTTLDLDAALIREASAAAPSRTKTELIEKGLQALVDQAARKRIAALAGKMPMVRAPSRRRKLA